MKGLGSQLWMCVVISGVEIESSDTGSSSVCEEFETIRDSTGASDCTVDSNPPSGSPRCCDGMKHGSIFHDSWSATLGHSRSSVVSVVSSALITNHQRTQLEL